MRYLTAKAIYSSHTGFISYGILQIDANGTIIQFFNSNEIDTKAIQLEHYEGILAPAFVNAHCHLELSHLCGQIQEHTGFVGFATELIPKRDQFTPDEITLAMQKADQEMWDNGIAGVGDISNRIDSAVVKAKSRIHYHTFIELLALHPSAVNKVMEQGKQLAKTFGEAATLAPHAPYSVSADLLKAIANHGTGPITIHNQESQAENQFLETGEGRVRDLYRFIGIDLDFYQAAGVNALRATLPHLLAKRHLLLVHNTFTTTEDLIWAESQHTDLYWCFCPKANLYIENALPNFNQFAKAGVRCAIGTDSLASNTSLSILDELKVIAMQAPQITTKTLLNWATAGGASALGFTELGSFEKGKKPGIIQLTQLGANHQILPETKVKRIG